MLSRRLNRHTNAHLALGAGAYFSLELLVIVGLVGASLRANGLLVQLLAALNACSGGSYERAGTG